MVSRWYTVSLKEVERFYNWTLLLHVKGATAFAEIPRVNSVQYRRFRKACKACGLLTDDREWVAVLAEAFRSSFEPFTHGLAKF